MDKVKAVAVALGALFGAFALPTLVFALKGHEVAAAVSATLLACTVLALIVVGAFAAGAAYTRSSMAMGAGIALRAQETNDRWDERKTATMGRLFEAGARAGRSTAAIGAQPALSLPSDEMDGWMPIPTEYQISEPAEAGDGRDW